MKILLLFMLIAVSFGVSSHDVIDVYEAADAIVVFNPNRDHNLMKVQTNDRILEGTITKHIKGSKVDFEIRQAGRTFTQDIKENRLVQLFLKEDVETGNYYIMGVAPL